MGTYRTVPSSIVRVVFYQLIRDSSVWGLEPRHQKKEEKRPIPVYLSRFKFEFLLGKREIFDAGERPI